VALFEKKDDADETAAALAELAKWTAGLQSGLQQFINGNRLTAHRPVPAGGRRLAWASQGRLVGWSVRATGGAVLVLLRDGREDGQGDVLAVLDLADGQTETVSLGVPGVAFGEALYLERTGAGQLTGSLYLGAVD
jgi:hypothetical protein